MIGSSLNFSNESSPTILCLGAHSDDIEIGCGGTILRLIDAYPQARVNWVVFGAIGERVREAQNSAEEFLSKAGDKRILIKGFRDGFFPYIGKDIKEFFEQLKQQVDPDIIFIHNRNDLHQDHRLLAELTWNTFRNHLILEYEIPKYDGDLGSPNVFVHLDAGTCRKKIELLERHFTTQGEKDWFDEELFMALLRIRGMESRAPDGYAEAFYGRKLITHIKR
ncbi:MAG: PIG-L deacetylase family protein [Anaerolineales bacterium]